MNDSVSQIQCLLEKKLSEEELVNGTASSMINKSSLIPDLNEDIMQSRSLSRSVDQLMSRGARDEEACSQSRACEDAYDLLLKLTRQTKPRSFSCVFNSERRPTIRMIGSGKYSKVFGFTNEESVVKLIPFGSPKIGSDETQMSVSHVLTEVLATQAITGLANNKEAEMSSESSSTGNFVHLRRVYVLQGTLPLYLLVAMKKFDRLNNGPAFTCPLNVYSRMQKWVALECSNCGEALSDTLLPCHYARLSVFTQTALALAVAERELNFEHRDLHLGNVLIKPVLGQKQCKWEAPPSTLDGQSIQPLPGPPVKLIDFTFSRLDYNQLSLYTNMTTNCQNVRKQSGPIVHIYNQMHDEVKGHWERFQPRTNCFWLTLLVAWFMTRAPLHECRSHFVDNAHNQWDKVAEVLWESTSAVDFIQRARKQLLFLFR